MFFLKRPDVLIKMTGRFLYPYLELMNNLHHLFTQTDSITL